MTHLLHVSLRSVSSDVCTLESVESVEWVESVELIEWVELVEWVEWVEWVECCSSTPTIHKVSGLVWFVSHEC
jgi:hypothetical protein